NLADEDTIKLQGWFDDEQNQVDAIMTEDEILYHHELNKIIQAMASFNPEAGDIEITLKENDEDLNTIIAKSWQPKEH
uniref:hypothetical protein n=1 Tax=Facilibium subflavum TaxID=2219058 RepID=UPI0013C29FFC